MNLEKETV